MEQTISLAHGDGGELSHHLIQEVFVKAFGNKEESKFDAAVISMQQGKIAVTTDSFVVKPLFFPGGSIGKLAVAGTVNDLAVSGAKPLYLTCGFIIEEGFLLKDLKTIVQNMADEATKAGVVLVAGDTKVVERGSCDGVFINTTGIGVIHEDTIVPSFEEGDAVIVSGTIGDHGIAIISARGDLGITSPVQSDCASLNHMLEEVTTASKQVRIMRDPTRGGLTSTLVEIAEDFGVTITLEEDLIPIKDEVHGACDLLGYDPMFLANEGKAIIIVANEDKEKVLDAIRQLPEGQDAVCIGKVSDISKGQLLLETPLGVKRALHRLSGIMLPRIC
ncbi:hydrogenase expression/formation protein HypE [Lysinibacillus sp. NPDC097287]|uniref:hydrogenase expression/formation protein HypE n=1 Tax=Lysinibacillus sp. NPDC097287 TaxID=3364144 RepID=UPI003804C517